MPVKTVEMKVQVISIVMSGFLQFFQCGEPGFFSINALLQTFVFFWTDLISYIEHALFNKFPITDWFALFSNVV